MVNYLKNVGEKFRSSSSELSKPVNLTISAMLLAVSVVLGYFGNISINFIGTNTIKISFAVVPIAVTAMLYGPVAAGIVGGLNDIICYMLAPQGGYIPGFTISMILVGIIYGIAFYKEKVNLKRVIIAEVIISIFINIILGVTWFTLFYGVPLKRALFLRGIKEIFDLPVSIAINFGMYKLLTRIPEVNRILKSTKKSESGLE